MLGFSGVVMHPQSLASDEDTRRKQELVEAVEDGIRRAAPPLTYFTALRRVSFPILFLCASTSLALLAVSQNQLQALQHSNDVQTARQGYIYSQIGRLNQTTWGLSAEINYLGNRFTDLAQADAASASTIANELGVLRNAFLMLVRALQNQTLP